MSDDILYEVAGGAAWITINRPEARNALNAAVREGLRVYLLEAESDARASVIVLRAAGGKVFCAGGDLKEMAANKTAVPPPDYVPQPGRTLQISKPVVAAVDGAALGGGFLLVQMADLVVATDRSSFGIAEIKVGRGAPWAAPLAWLLPPRIAMQLLVTGDSLTAQRAYEVGLVNEVVAPDQLNDRVAALVAKIAGNAPLSVRAGKATVYAAASHTREDAFDAAERIWQPVYLSEDAQEGPRAFTEKRKPVWQAR